MTVGGWQSRTTVEDMDLSLRTYVNGWKAVYLTDTTCLNEVSCCWLRLIKGLEYLFLHDYLVKRLPEGLLWSMECVALLCQRSNAVKAPAACTGLVLNFLQALGRLPC